MSDDEIQDDERDAFLKEMAQVKPIKSGNKVSHNIKRKPVSNKTHIVPEKQGYDVDDNYSEVLVEDCPEHLSFSRSGIQHAMLKKLRQGKNPIEAHLDLHGMTVAEARQALLYFIAECEDLGYRYTLVVHGKGYSSPNNKPVIKAYVNSWLRDSASVLAFCSALPSDGGTGAVYLLHKKNC